MEFDPARNRRRAYRMGARAESVAANGRRIEAAAEALFVTRPYDDVTLQAIADDASVTLQTVLRRYGSKEGLFNAIVERRSAEIFASRAPADPGDHVSAIRLLVASYEAIGDMNWHMLGQESQSQVLKGVLDQARRSHAAWLERTFAHLLPAERGPERERRLMLLFAATDFYVWKLLRRDLGLPLEVVTQHVLDLVQALALDFGRRSPEPPTRG